MAAWLSEIQKVVADTSLPINKKADEVLKHLFHHKPAYKQTLTPQQLLCHPDNRSGQMLNGFDVHSKGKTICSIGFSFAKLGQSIAFELPADSQKKMAVVSKNQVLHTMSNGMLAKVNGHERWATISTSHTTAFLKAVQQGCSTTEEDLAANGILSMEFLGNRNDDLKDMIQEGWEWTCISSQVEKAMPSLAAFLQQALNSHLFATKGLGCVGMLFHWFEILFNFGICAAR